MCDHRRSGSLYIAPAYFVAGSFWGICSVISMVRCKNLIFDALLLSHHEREVGVAPRMLEPDQIIRYPVIIASAI